MLRKHCWRQEEGEQLKDGVGVERSDDEEGGGAGGGRTMLFQSVAQGLCKDGENSPSRLTTNLSQRCIEEGVARRLGTTRCFTLGL